MSIHDCVMTPACGQTDQALWVAPLWPPCGSAQLGQGAALTGAMHYRLTTAAKQRGLLGM
ncbi:hypothetical protein B0E50_07545 [Rhodanobacter sp. C01]|nr:hypothetical protein B0E50_07545 [Rhodanobacter sp. C01]